MQYNINETSVIIRYKWLTNLKVGGFRTYWYWNMEKADTWMKKYADVQQTNIYKNECITTDGNLILL